MRTSILTVLTTVALVQASLGRAAEFPIASAKSPGYITIGAGCLSDKDRDCATEIPGHGLDKFWIDIQKRKQERKDECDGIEDASIVPMCHLWDECYTSADLLYTTQIRDEEMYIECNRIYGKDAKCKFEGTLLRRGGSMIPIQKLNWAAAIAQCDKTYCTPANDCV